MNEDQVKTLLKSVIDPELGINIVDLGLIYEVKIDEILDRLVRDTRQTVEDDTEDFRSLSSVSIKMTLTTPGCPLGGFFLEEVTRVVAEGLGIQNEQVTIEFVFDPPWTQDMMNEEAIAELGLE